MTYLRKTLDEICRSYCPICSECDITHLCVNMKAIRDRIIEIMTDGVDDS